MNTYQSTASSVLPQECEEQAVLPPTSVQSSVGARGAAAVGAVPGVLLNCSAVNALSKLLGEQGGFTSLFYFRDVEQKVWLVVLPAKSGASHCYLIPEGKYGQSCCKKSY